MKRKISVIIPIYNMEKYLQECLDTVMRQSLKEIEIICVNDGSTDRSEYIVKENARKDTRIRLISKENGGAASARNAALELAEGEFVIFIDPDDIYPADDILEALYKKAKEQHVFICGGSFSEISKERGLVTKFEGVRSKFTFEKDGLVDYKDYQFDYGYHRFIYDLEFLRNKNIYFPPYLRYQDPPFFVRAMALAKKFYAMQKIVYQYRVGHQSVQWNERKLTDLLKGLRDNLSISGQEQLDELHLITLKRIRKTYQDMFASHIHEYSSEYIRLLFEIDALVNKDLLKMQKDGMEYADVVPQMMQRAINIERSRLEQIEKEQKKLEKEYQLVINSKSYQLGCFFTCIPRKLKQLLLRK